MEALAEFWAWVATIDWTMLNPATFGEWIAQYPEYGLLFAIAFALFVSFTPLPMETIAIMNGLWFGPLVGAIYTWIGALIAATLAFFIAKLIGYPLVKRLLPKRAFGHMEDLVRRRGPPALIAIRMIPAIPFTVINYGAGVTPLKWQTFVWTSALGFVPPTILFVYLGNTMREQPLLGMGLLVVIAIAAFTCAVLISRRMGREASPVAE